MGQARLRGTFEQRQANAIARNQLREEAIQLAAYRAGQEGRNLRLMPRAEQRERIATAVRDILNHRRELAEAAERPPVEVA